MNNFNKTMGSLRDYSTNDVASVVATAVKVDKAPRSDEEPQLNNIKSLSLKPLSLRHYYLP